MLPAAEISVNAEIRPADVNVAFERVATSFREPSICSNVSGTASPLATIKLIRPVGVAVVGLVITARISAYLILLPDMSLPQNARAPSCSPCDWSTIPRVIGL